MWSSIGAWSFKIFFMTSFYYTMKLAASCRIWNVIYKKHVGNIISYFCYDMNFKSKIKIYNSSKKKIWNLKSKKPCSSYHFSFCSNLFFANECPDLCPKLQGFHIPKIRHFLGVTLGHFINGFLKSDTAYNIYHQWRLLTLTTTRYRYTNPN